MMSMSFSRGRSAAYEEVAFFKDSGLGLSGVIAIWSAPRFDCSPWGRKMRRTALSFANTSSDCLGSIREPRAKGVSQVRCRTFRILKRPTGRDPGGFRGCEREQADCSGPVACSVVQRTTMLNYAA